MHENKLISCFGMVLLAVLWTANVGVCQIVTDGLLCHWSFDAADISGQTAKDVWGNRDGTIFGDTELVPGKNGESLEFDGNGDYILFDDAGLPQGSTPRTMSAWVRPEGTGIRSIVEWGTAATGQRSGILVLADEYVKFVGAGGRDVTSNGRIPASEWSHIAETYDGQRLRIYLNGQLDKEQVHVIETRLSGEATIGKKVRQANEFFNGAIDEVSIYDKALSDSEVARNFAAMEKPSHEKARAAEPMHGTSDVPRDVVLSWQPGDYAIGHDVYFGTVLVDVENASRTNPGDVLVRVDQSTTTYDAGRLDLGETYYWRIDEVNAPPDNTIFKGTVWSFTVEPVAIAIDQVTAVASSATDPNGPLHLVDGSGMDPNDLHGSDKGAMWLSDNEPNGAWIQFKFDKAYVLHELLVWNHNTELETMAGYGAKDVLMQCSLDGSTWEDLGAIQIEQAPGEGNPASAQMIDCADTIAQWVKLMITSNYSPLGIQQFGLSEVRFLCIPTFARTPEPKDGDVDVNQQTVLSWRAGRQAAAHDLYLSTDEQTVIDGTAPVVTVTESSYATLFDLDSTYYWRIDEVNDLEMPSVWPGDVWSFSTEEYIVVDDFESYTNDSPNRVWQTWIDGVGFSPDEFFPNGNNGNGTGAMVGYNPEDGSIMETATVHTGKQAMPLFYDNTGGTANSVVTRTFDEAEDWTQSRVRGLVLYFHGEVTNTGGQLYVKINDKKVSYDGDAENLARVGWNKWYIVLNELDGVDLSQVRSLSVGVENGGQGVLYIDDITLSPHEREVAIPVEPEPANLVAHYAFEGDAADSTGQHPGSLRGNPVFTTGPVGQAISLDGVGQYIEIAGFKGILGVSPITVTAWIKTSSTVTGTIVGWGPTANGQLFELRVNENRLRIEHAGGNIQGDTAINDGTWHHVAVTVQANATMSYPEVIVWVDGLDNARPATSANPFNLTADKDVRIGSRPVNDDRFFVGQIDELYLYDRVLSSEEIAWLAGRTLPFDK